MMFEKNILSMLIPELRHICLRVIFSHRVFSNVIFIHSIAERDLKCQGIPGEIRGLMSRCKRFSCLFRVVSGIPILLYFLRRNKNTHTYNGSIDSGFLHYYKKRVRV